MNEEKKIFINHHDWQEHIIIYNNEHSLIRESKPDIKINDFFYNFHFLKINWPQWGTDYFYSNDGEVYYQHVEKYSSFFIKHFSYFYTQSWDSEKLYFANHEIGICYDFHNTNYYFYFGYKNNQFILYDEKSHDETIYVFFENKYLEKYFYNYHYLLINYQTQNNLEPIILEKQKKTFYFQNNKNNNGSYTSYKNILLFKTLFDTFYIIKKETHYELLNNLENKPKNYLIKEYIDLIDENTIVFLFNGMDHIYLIKYFKKMNYSIFIMDSIDQYQKNNIYDDLNIYYYKENEIDKWLKELNQKKINYFINTTIYELEGLIDLQKNSCFQKQTQLNIESQNTKKIFIEKIKNTNIITPQKVHYFNNSIIPKIFHFIWLGNQQYPDEYMFFLNSWLSKYNDGTYLFCFWNDTNLIDLYNQELFDNSISFAQKADIARYEILYHYGGVYVDADIYACQKIDDLIKNNTIGFSGYESEDYIAIGLMGFSKKNNFLEKIIMHLELNSILNKNEKIPYQTGPVYFTKMWNLFVKKDKQYKAFEPKTFYTYSFQDKHEMKPILLNEQNYTYHSWGYSWNTKKRNINNYKWYHLLFFVYNKQLQIENQTINLHNSNHSFQKMSDLLKPLLFYQPKTYVKKNKLRIINIMGHFFVGGIERYMLYLDKYGDHEKYEYFLLSMTKDDNELFNHNHFKHINHIYFKNNQELYNLLLLFNPDFIIDHYSQYINENIYLYDLYQDHNIHMIHSAIHYKRDFSKLNIKKCIHLYDEKDKHNSWNTIQYNFIIPLGIEHPSKKTMLDLLHTKKEKRKKNKIINIGIIGRVVQEKIPIYFFKKLCSLSKELIHVVVYIYGEKNNINGVENNYNELFDTYIQDSNIIYKGGVSFSEIDSVYKNMDCILIPSVYETGSFTCLEAFSYGIPVLSYNHYGMKYLIKNNINGYLFDNQDDLLEKIKYLYYDDIFLNGEFIYQKSLNYQIQHKINNMQNCITQFNMNSKNVVLITSVLNIIKKELSYYHQRSVFNVHERFEQTLKTIKSIKEKIPHVFIIFCECSNMDLYQEYELQIKQKVHVYSNFYQDIETKEAVKSIYKGYGEGSLVLKGLELLQKQKINVCSFFKLSGRYFLNNDFQYEHFNNDYNCFKLWDNNFNSFCSLFYKLHGKYISVLKYTLIHHLQDLKQGSCLEMILGKYMKDYLNHYYLHILNKINVSGYLSTEGYYFNL